MLKLFVKYINYTLCILFLIFVSFIQSTAYEGDDANACRDKFFILFSDAKDWQESLEDLKWLQDASTKPFILRDEVTSKIIAQSSNVPHRLSMEYLSEKDLKRSDLSFQNVDILNIPPKWSDYFIKGYSIGDLLDLSNQESESFSKAEFLSNDARNNWNMHLNHRIDEVRKMLLWAPMKESTISLFLKKCQKFGGKCEVVHRLRWLNAISVYISLDSTQEQCHSNIEKLLVQIQKMDHSPFNWKRVEQMESVQEISHEQASQNTGSEPPLGHSLPSNSKSIKKINLNKNKESTSPKDTVTPNLIKDQQPSSIDEDNIQVIDHIENGDINVENPLYLYRYGELLDEFTYGNSGQQLNLIKASHLHRRGLTGKNVTVLLLDSGFDWRTHEALQNITIKDTWDFVKGDRIVWNEPDDHPQQIVHGSKVLGLIAGKKENSYYGPAFDAEYLLAKTEDTSKETPIEEDNFAAALEWGLKLGANIMSASLGYSFSTPDGKSSISTVGVNTAISLGLTCIVAVGNYGSKGTKGSLVTPSDSYNVIAVGAVDYQKSRGYFSSLGPSVDNRIKPEVVAFGVNNYVVEPRTESSYSRGSGTSYAAPLVAGVIAQLMERYPSMKGKPKYVRKLLIETASRMKVNDEEINNFYGFGLVDGEKAFFRGCETSECIDNTCMANSCTCTPDISNGYCYSSDAHPRPVSIVMSSIFTIVILLLLMFGSS